MNLMQLISVLDMSSKIRIIRKADNTDAVDELFEGKRNDAPYGLMFNEVKKVRAYCGNFEICVY